MAFDGLFTHAMTRELSAALAGGKVSKIQQPYPTELVMTIRNNGKNQPLLISANPQFARLQITEIPFTSPAVPSTFTMTLRKYLAAAKLISIEQVGNDRVVHLNFATRDELGDDLQLRLVVEIMARHSNITLVNVRENRIIDLIRHVPADENRYRLLMPGADYVPAPAQDKIDPFTATSADYLEFTDSAMDAQGLAKAIQAKFQGLDRISALELATRMQKGLAGIAWQEFFDSFNDPQPTVTTGKKMFYTAIPYGSIDGTQQQFPSLSAMLDAFYAQRAERERVQVVGSGLIRVLKTNTHRLETKIKKFKQTLAESERADELRLRGELLTTYLQQVPRGAKSVELPNYYDEMKPLTIQLNPALGPNQNAQKYYTRYQKLRKSVSHVNEQMAEANAELDYLNGISDLVNLAAPKDLEDIRTELEQSGYIRRSSKNKRKRPKVSKPDAFWASDGTHILVGKNNLQNDQLTLKTAAKTDIWLHAKDVPGSHVIIEDSAPSDQTLTEAANLAAYYSRSQHSANVQVDYIQVKRIKKPNGAKPGYVIYTGQRTLVVTPDETLVEKMKTKPTM
ncbi:NFACT RNA binding domain-containing protein [Lacticaseibacillus songhuajiangensis]|jgi:predicted ribosome quality control (RQC) complex YloA/Tae2 family protein|uniref:NFACT RNA binding domain-containing protein n=1 Tax=Lacticaseibacillus songhuajiangensis TaxID=1296539 RepID=UPI000F7B5269|nr:NFACT RNA binding domain-containing protein [Lacticaseibacillus songhuajiangensis]